MDGERVEWALRWARKGFRVFPLVPGSKKPAFEGWTESATRDEEQICAWWARRPDCNIGVLTDDLIVVDVDVKNGKPGDKSFLELGLSFDDMDTLTTESPSGGKHVYFSGPSRSLSVGRLGPGLDIRSYHGYVVGPGSYIDERVDATAGCSGWYSVSNDVPVRDVPAEILSRLDAPIERVVAPVVRLDDPAAVERATAFLIHEAPPAVQGQGGDATTFKVAAWLKDEGVSEETAFELMQEHYLPRCAAEFSPAEMAEWVRVKVANAYKFGSKPPGVSSPEHQFAGVDLPPPETVNSAPTIWFRHGDTWDPDQAWLFYQLLPANLGVCALTAPEQAGKTFLLIHLAMCLATGQPFFETEPDERGGTVFLFTGTEGSGFEQRLAALQEEQELPISGAWVKNLGEVGALGNLVNEIRAEDARMRTRFGVPLRLVVLETLSASGLIRDENDNTQAAMAIANLHELSKYVGCPVMFSHHPPKDGRGSRGAGAITANLDYHLEVTRSNRDPVRQVELRKARGAPQRKLGSFTLLPVKLGADRRGRDVVSMVVSTGKAERITPKEVHSELLTSCIDWICIDDPTVIDGEEAALYDSVYELFRERKDGSKEKSRVSRAFTEALQFALDLGAVENVIHRGSRYLKRKEVL